MAGAAGDPQIDPVENMEKLWKIAEGSVVVERNG